MPNFSPYSLSKYRSIHILLTIAVFVFISGCSSRSHVKHLASDAILIVPQQSTAKDVISLLGQPDQRQKLSAEVEEWIFLQKKQSFLKKTPYIGKIFGYEDVDLMVIHFKEGLVTSRTYRLLTEAEFKASGIKSNNQLNAK